MRRLRHYADLNPLLCRGLTDPQTGIFSADTRYNFRTHDGANILLQTSGPAQPRGGLQLRVLFETGDKDYYWLNNVVAVGLLSSVGERKPGESYFLKIDVWHVSTSFFHFLAVGWEGGHCGAGKCWIESLLLFR